MRGSWVWRVASWRPTPWPSRARDGEQPPDSEILIQNFRFDPPIDLGADRYPPCIIHSRAAHARSVER
jgi:hypothetical protein